MTIITPDGPSIPFTPPEVGSANAQQLLTVFTPPNPNGRVLIHNWTGSFIDANPRAFYDDSDIPDIWIVSLWMQGVTIVSYGLTGTNASHVGTGLWRPYTSNEYLNRWDYSWPERDAEHIVQKVRSLIRAGVIKGDLRKIGWVGVSSSAVCGLAIGLGPNRARPSGSSQVQESTRLSFVVAFEPYSFWPAFEDSFFAWHWPDGGVGDTPALGIGDVPEDQLIESSPIQLLNERAAAGHPVSPVYMTAADPVESTDFTFDGSQDLPTLRNALGGIHPYWEMLALAKRMRQIDAQEYDDNWRLVVESGIELPAPNDEHHHVVSALYGTEMQADLLQWIDARFDQPDTNPGGPGSGVGAI